MPDPSVTGLDFCTASDARSIVRISPEGVVTFDPEMIVEEGGHDGYRLSAPWTTGYLIVHPESRGFIEGHPFSIWDALMKDAANDPLGGPT